MKVSILHLSDIHFSLSRNNPILYLTDAIASAISGQPYGDNIIIAVSGDIAFSGKKEEYDIASSFFEDLQLKINERINILPSLIIVPGNHDCDFTLNDQTREIVLNGISSSVIEQATYKLGTSVQVEYDTFAANTSVNLKNCAEGIGYKIKQLKMIDGVITFRLHNTAWMSKPNETVGIIIPTAILPSAHAEELLNAELSVGIMHHTFNWLRSDCSRQLRDNLHATCDIVLTGHEHESGGYQNVGYRRDITEYREGGVLQSCDNPKDSSFNFIFIDTQKETIDIHEFTLKGQMYSSINNNYSRKFTRNMRRLKQTFSISEEMSKKLDNLDIVFNHPYKSSLSLDDLFVYPECCEISSPGSKNKPKQIREASADLLIESQNIYFAAPEKAGKTMLSKRLFLDLHVQGTMPILARGKIFKKTDDQSIIGYISELVGEQYSKEAIEPYHQLTYTERAIIIDDYDQVRLKGKHRNNLLLKLAAKFSKIILLGHNDSRWEELYEATQSKEQILTPEILSYKHYELIELGPIKRSELVRRWHQTGASDEIDQNIFHRKLIEAEEIISNTIGKNLLPSYPIFILLLIQLLENKDGVPTTHGAQGYLYESLITNSLKDTSDYLADIDIQYKYLSELAYKLFQKKNHEISIEEMEQWHIEHCNKYLIRLDYEKLIIGFIRAQIIKKRDGYLIFVYPYTRYYFTARHLRDNIATDETKELITKLTTQLYQQEAANILIFLAYLCKDEFVLNAIIKAANNLFSETAIFNYAAPPDFLGKLETSNPKLILDVMSPSQARKDELLLREEIERDEKENNMNGNDDIEATESLSKISFFNSAIRTIQILGQILRSFPGSLSADDKILIVKECYNLSLRATGFCISFLEKYGPDISAELIKLTTTLHPEAYRKDLEQETNAFMYGLCERMAFGMIKHVSRAIGLEELAPVFRKILDGGNNRSYEIFDLSVKLDHYQNFPKEETLEIHEKLKDIFFSHELIRKLVWYHLHMFPVPYDIRQSICTKLQIDYKPYELLQFGRMINK
ncbi:MAG: metallophosphoesterase [Smithella sp.]|jgi:hypothetical protein